MDVSEINRGTLDGRRMLFNSSVMFRKVNLNTNLFSKLDPTIPKGAERRLYVKVTHGRKS
jgi:hypothetical protein